ncbi:MAG: dihydropteroate synthase [Planctomycetia bacterium]|nr:dihydropteroate synthase [Planctomycetia bacterium]
MTSTVSPISSWSLRTQKLDFSASPVWMGIINLTSDSFSDGGRFCKSIDDQRIQLNIPEVLDYAFGLTEQGAGILDIGGESSRPGSEPILELEEIQRVISIVQRLAKKTKIPISVDTTRASVAELAILAGAEIINDISGGTFDPLMLKVIRRYQPGYCLMHIPSLPKTMQNAPVYQNVVEDVFHWLKERLNFFLDSGIPQEKICLDVGIGFGKTFEQNIELLRNIERFHELGCPILIGHSRKSFLNPFYLQTKWQQNVKNISISSKFSSKESILVDDYLESDFCISKENQDLSLQRIKQKNSQIQPTSKSITFHPEFETNSFQEINVPDIENRLDKYVDSVQLNAIRDDWTAMVSVILARKKVQILRVHDILKNQAAVILDRMLQSQDCQ